MESQDRPCVSGQICAEQAGQHPCPQCESPMYEVERREEADAVYVWLECVNTVCRGQWLERVARW